MDPAATPGRRQGHDYTVIRRIASGGMAELYVGRARGVGGAERLVALKRVLPEFARDERFVEMFLDEARINITLQHPNIVQTYDVVQDRGTYLLVMEYLEGADLRQYVRQHLKSRRELVPIPQVLQIGIAVLSGLHYAHERRSVEGAPLNIVHRDISPQNIFLTYDGGIRVLDFGIAKASTATSNTETGGVKGKVRYMSPEQSVGGQIDRRSDVYALGVVLYELLTGRRLYDVKGNFAILRAVVEQTPKKPSELHSRVPADLDAIVMKALAKKRRDRYPTALDFQLALEDYARSTGIYPSALELGRAVRGVLGPPERAWNDPFSETEAVSLAEITGSDSAVPLGDALTPLESTDHATLQRHGDVTLVRFRGRLNEGFDGEAVGRQLRGTVVFDLEEVERITSFGIRSWLEMLDECRSKVDALYFARCPEPFVNQVTMIRGVLGSGRVVSFYAPYLCPTTQEPMPVLLHGSAGMRAVRDKRLPAVRCPSGEAAVFDEDPAIYLDFADEFEPNPPESVLGLIGEAQTAVRERDVEKLVERDRTVFSIHRELDGDLPWRRLLSGLEGRVVLDCATVPSATPAGVQAMVRVIARQASELGRLELRSAPPLLHQALLASRPLAPLVHLNTLRVPCACTACGIERRADVREAEAHVALAPGGILSDTCRVCNGPLALGEEGRAALAYLADSPPAKAPASHQIPRPGRPTHGTAPALPATGQTKTPARRTGGCLARILGLAMLAGLLIGAAQLTSLFHMHGDPSPLELP